jgi:recombinational DNA repair protein (RecF pathway)
MSESIAEHRCADCGTPDLTIMLVTSLGDRLCRRCWVETTTIPAGHQPATPTLDRHLRHRDELARERAAERSLRRSSPSEGRFGPLLGGHQ